MFRLKRLKQQPGRILAQLVTLENFILIMQSKKSPQQKFVLTEQIQQILSEIEQKCPGIAKLFPKGPELKQHRGGGGGGGGK